MGYTHSSTNGSSFFYQHQTFRREVTPEIIAVMERANADPVVNAWCLANGINDAFVIYDKIVEHGKRKYMEKLRVLSEAEYKRLDSELPVGMRSTDPPYSTHRCHGSGFDRIYNIHNDGKCLYQCRCGLVMVNSHPRAMGDDYTHHWNGNGPPGRSAALGPMPKAQTVDVWKIKIVPCEETVAEDGSSVFNPVEDFEA